MSDQPTDDLPQTGVFPHLVVDGAADAIDFYTRAFGATETMRLPGPEGRLMHAAVLIEGCMVMLVDEYPEEGLKSPKTLGGTPVTIHIGGVDVDATYARALEAGATEGMAPQDMFWGDRYAVVIDPFGHHWSISKPQGDRPLTPDEITAAMPA